MRKRIVVIDDDADVCTSYLDQFEGIYEIDAFTDPREARKFLMTKKNEIGVVFCDIRMPHIDGRHLLSEFGHELPFYMITGELIDGGDLESYTLADLLYKPFSITKILDLAKRHVDIDY